MPDMPSTRAVQHRKGGTGRAGWAGGPQQAGLCHLLRLLRGCRHTRLLPGAGADLGDLGLDPCSTVPVAGDGGWRCSSSIRSRTLFPQVPGCIGAGHLWGSASTLHRVLEECASLLTTFWSTVLPVGPAQHQGKVSTMGIHQGEQAGCSLLTAYVSSQEQALQSEITALRAQLSKREDALHNTAKQLHSMAQLKDSMEQFIVSQCMWHGHVGLVPLCLGSACGTGTLLTLSLCPSQ